jgi:hypothetical protein
VIADLLAFSLTPRIAMPVLASAALAVTGCRPPDRKDRPMSPELQCAAAPLDDGRTRIRYQLRNTGAAAIHVLESRRMPYQLVSDEATLVILHGVNPPDPDTLYNMIEIPTTRPVAPGEAFEGEVVLPLEMLRDHYGERRAPERLRHGKIQVRCEVGWGTTPITEAERAKMSIQSLLTWQQLTRHGPFEVVLK